MSGTPLQIWTIYDHPRDYPHGYVARCYDVTAGKVAPTDDVIQATDLNLLRDVLEMRGLTPLGREDGDDEHIIESWI